MGKGSARSKSLGPAVAQSVSRRLGEGNCPVCGSQVRERGRRRICVDHEHDQATTFRREGQQRQ